MFTNGVELKKREGEPFYKLVSETFIGRSQGGS